MKSSLRSRFITVALVSCTGIMMFYLKVYNRQNGLDHTNTTRTRHNHIKSGKAGVAIHGGSNNLVVKPGNNIQQYLSVSVLQESTPERMPYDFSITPWKICPERTRFQEINQTKIKWSMVVFIKSRADHISQRTRVRTTWARFEYYDGLRLEVIFILGNAGSGLQEKIRKENESYGDILQTNVEETYRNLIHKSVAGMQYASQNFPATWFYSSADDDVVLDLSSAKDKLLDLIKKTNVIISTKEPSNCTFENELPIFCGFGYNDNAMVMRATVSKWYVPKELYSRNTYPIYCNGGWYSMSVKLAGELYALSKKTNYFWIDDVWITGLLRLKYFSNSAQGCFLDDVKVGLWTYSRKVAFSSDYDSHWALFASKIRTKSFVPTH